MAAKELQASGVSLTIGGRQLGLDALERAFDEVMYLRRSRVPDDQLDTSVLTKFGRLSDGVE